MLNKDLASELFLYENGILYWKTTLKKAGYKRKDGYVQGIRLNGSNYLAHRIIFLLHYGYMPDVVDHIDGNPANNSIENLRESSTQTNQYNRKLNKDNTSGVKNVYFARNRNKWRVEIKVNKRKRSFGSYEDLELAELVAIEARSKYHKEFCRNT